MAYLGRLASCPISSVFQLNIVKFCELFLRELRLKCIPYHTAASGSEKCYAYQFECDCSSGPQDCGWRVFREVFLTFDSEEYGMYAYMYTIRGIYANGKPKFYLHSGCWIGEFKKTTSHTDDVIQKIKWR
jgi:hypothetical protein